MAKITLDLNQFKASGVYTVEYDQTETITVSSQTIRLVVGFSRKGPFNAPVFLRDIKSARQIFGEIDTILEKRGSFFHRAIETCLQTGPIYALNLLALNNTPNGDKIDYRAFSTSITQDNADIKRELIASFYNKERFWFPDTSYLQAIVNNNLTSKDMLLSFTNFSQKPVSVIIRKAANIKGFNITARDFYGAGNVPQYIKDFDYISDYFIDVIVVEGDWTNYEILSIDPQYSKYFTSNGIKTELIEQFCSDDTITMVASITGCIIPDFTDKNGSNHFIENNVNNTVGTTGLFMTVNREMLDDYENSQWKLDLIGHSLIGTTKDAMNFLSYVGPITDELYYSSNYTIIEETETATFDEKDFNIVNNKQQNIYLKSLPYVNNSSPFFNTLVIPKPKMLFSEQQFTLSDYTKLANSLTTNSLIKAFGFDYPGRLNNSGYLKVDSISNTGSSLELVLSNPEKNSELAGIFSGITITNVNEESNTLTLNFAKEPAANIAQFDMIYVNGANKYYVIDTMDSSTGSPSVPGTPGVEAHGDFIEIPFERVEHLITEDPVFDEGTIYFDEETQTFNDWNGTSFDSLDVNIVTTIPDSSNLGESDNNNYYSDTNTLMQWIWRPEVSEVPEIPATPYIYTVRLFKNIEELEIAISGSSVNQTVLMWYLQWLPTNMNVVANTLNNKTAYYCNEHLAEEYMTNFTDGLQYIVNTLYIADTPSDDDFYIDVYPGNNLYTEISNKSIIDGDYVSKTADFSQFNYLSFTKEIGMYGLPIQRIRQWWDKELTSPIKNNGNNYADFVKMDQGSYTRSGIRTDHVDPDNPDQPNHVWLEIAKAHGLIVNEDADPSAAPTYIAIQSAASKIETKVPIVVNTVNASKTSFRIDAASATEIEVGQFLVVDTELAGGEQRLTKVINKIRKANSETGFTEYEIQVNESIAISYDAGNNAFVTRYLPIPKIANTLQWTALSGFTITAYHMPGGKDQLAKIYGVIENTNLADTLVDKELISYRYIVDTMSGGLDTMMGSKVILSRLAKRRQKCMALLNAPSIAEFITSTDPRFTDEPQPELGIPKPLLKTEYISTGGNLSLGPSFKFSLPDDENGAKFCGVFSPFLKIYEQNTNKMIPPAADVSNNFVNKFINGQPYAIAAGPKRGIISNSKMTGLEYEFLLADREWLEPFGINPIVTTKNTGPMIYGNNTAYQRTLTAYNNLHVRDLLITIEETVEDILSNYIFEFNDASTRLEIRTIVEGYLQTVKNSGGIYDYMVIMDQTNNTQEVIDANCGIIDIGIEPARGLQKVINRVTLVKTGQIASGGFTVS